MNTYDMIIMQIRPQL